MRYILTLVFSVFFFAPIFGQEICNNAIDDDGDGLIDLNDNECDCLNLIDLSVIPNPSFEEMLCCPDAEAMLDCATNWIQASGATSDYYNFCGLSEFPFDGAVPPELPLPGGGEGFIGLYNFSDSYREYAGACTMGPLLAGVNYSLTFSTAYAFGEEDQLEFRIYGSPNCAALPWMGIGCPEGIGSWQLLATELITYTMDGSWQTVTVSFTPAVNINVIAIGGPCGDIGETDGSYFYFDELILAESDVLGYIDQVGGWCSEDIQLTATVEDAGGTWQWYRDGIALIGETSDILFPFPYGPGEFTAVYSFVGGCKRMTYSSPDVPKADFDFNTICFGEMNFLENLSTGSGDAGFKWDFGDGFISNTYNTTHLFGAPGSYFVSLVAYSEDPSCNDTVIYELSVLEKPNVDFEISGAGINFTGSDWIGCAKDSLQFTDLTTVVGPMSLSNWTWDFGDGTTSSVQNPTHFYLSEGSYSVKLVVEAESGCTDSIIYDLFLTSVTADFSTDSVCEGTPVIFDNNSFTSDGTMINSWNWYFGDETEVDYSIEPTHDYENYGAYEASLRIGNGLGCWDSISKLVIVNKNPTPSVYASENPTDYFNTELLLSLVSPNESSSYFWEMPEGSPPTSISKTNTLVFYPEFVVATYEVTVIEINEAGCIDSTKLIIQVKEDEMIFAPNTFTPNGDLFNEDWGVYSEGFLNQEFELQIFNRWGELIWITTDADARWNGTYIDGTLVEDGVYVWYITARDQITDEKFTYRGTVNVFR